MISYTTSISYGAKSAVLLFFNKFCTFYGIPYYVNIFFITCTLFNFRARGQWGDPSVDIKIDLQEVGCGGYGLD
jgi:hypothetical protein